jgi:hypothetical protein
VDHPAESGARSGSGLADDDSRHSRPATAARESRAWQAATVDPTNHTRHRGIRGEQSADVSRGEVVACHATIHVEHIAETPKACDAFPLVRDD